MEKRKMEKEGKNKSQHFGFLSHKIHDHSQVYRKFEDPGSHRNREICYRNFV